MRGEHWASLEAEVNAVEADRERRAFELFMAEQGCVSGRQTSAAAEAVAISDANNTNVLSPSSYLEEKE